MSEPSHVPIAATPHGGKPIAEGSVLHRLLEMVAQRIAEQRAAEGTSRDSASALTRFPREGSAAGCRPSQRS